METKKLYYEDAYLSRFEAVVTKVLRKGKETLVVLDQTAFFPESGGQPGDAGFLSGEKVSDTRIENGEVLHVCGESCAFTEGVKVEGELDFQTRFERMQGHSGEHVLSGLAHKRFGAENSGFHMESDGVMTVDFDVFLSKEDLVSLEEEANRVIWEDRIITARSPTSTELQSISYRSKLEDLKHPRIVFIEGVDACACCAPHLKSTAGIGVLKILFSMRHRGGVRLTLVCGEAALRDYKVKQNAALHVSDVLACRHDETASAVDALLEKNRALQYEMNARTLSFFEYIAQNSPKTPGNAVFFLPGLTTEDLKKAAVTLKSKAGGLTVALSGSDENGWYFAMTSDTLDAKNYVRAAAEALQGSGGGRFDVVQGRFQAKREEIERYFSTGGTFQ